MLRATTLAAALALAACQGPPPLHDVRPAATPSVALGDSLAPLAAAFDAHADVPRVIALLPPRCGRCSSGLEAVRAGLLEAFPARGLHVLVVLPACDRCDGCGAPALEGLADRRVSLFRDQEGCAARAFARGLLPVAEAQDVFLFYPAGARWRDASAGATPTPPRAEEWWHRLGRIAPERNCTPQELDGTLRATMAELLRSQDAGSVAQH